jgi:hypothetical protein
MLKTKFIVWHQTRVNKRECGSAVVLDVIYTMILQKCRGITFVVLYMLTSAISFAFRCCIHWRILVSVIRLHKMCSKVF